MWIKKLLLILVLCPVCQAVNNFSTNSNCKAAWNVDNGALTVDSKGTNTLTNSSITADTAVFKEGDASAYSDALSDDLYILDAALDAGFPLKNGDANKKITVCMWIRSSGFPASANRVFLQKGNATGYDASFVLYFRKPASWTITMGIGVSGGTGWETVDYGTTVSANTWYHVGATFQDSDKSWKLRIWDDTAGAILGGVTVSGTTTNNINIEDGAFYIGSAGADATGGWRDEIVVFNDILTDGEIDQVRAGTFGAATPAAGGQVIMIEEF